VPNERTEMTLSATTCRMVILPAPPTTSIARHSSGASGVG
jgi:hypothetical protein